MQRIDPMSSGNDSSLDTLVTGNSVTESGVTSGMFRPTYVCGWYPTNDTVEVKDFIGMKYCTMNCTSEIVPAGAVKEQMEALLSCESGNRVPGASIPHGFHIAVHGGSVCFALPPYPHGSATASEFKVYMRCNSLEEQADEMIVYSTPRLDHGKPFMNLLLHMTVDHNGQDYKILVGGRYPKGESYTFVYDSKRPLEPWLPILGGPLFVVTYVQGGAIYKPAHTSECLLCISSLDDVTITQISSFNFMMKKWSTLSMPEVSRALLGIEECGGIIFLFSQAKIDEDILFFIHKLNGVSYANIASWEEITRRKRDPSCKMDFYIYGDTEMVPREETIHISGGCIFVFNLTSSTEGSHVSIHAWTVDVDGIGRWGPKLSVQDGARIQHQAPKQIRSPNWTVAEHGAFKTAEEEAAEKNLTGMAKWKYISEKLRRLGSDRSPKQCRDRGDTIGRPGANPVAGRSTGRKDTMGSPSTSTRSKRSKSLTDAQGPSSSTPLNRDSTSIIIQPSDVRPDESLACPARDQGCSTSGKSEKCALDWYLRGEEAFARIEKPLTDDQKTVLYQKLVDLDLLQLKAKIPVQPYSELSRFLGGLHHVPNANTDKLFEWLMQHLEMDRLEIVKRVPATSDATE